MQHWDRNTVGQLERSSAPQEQSCELSIHDGQMEPPPEEQQSQQEVQRNPNAYRTMRDHVHLSRVSAPSCIVLPPEDIIIKPYLVPLLPTFHGMKSENVATLEPVPTRLVSPNRNPGDACLFLFVFCVIKFSFSKMPRPESPA